MFNKIDDTISKIEEVLSSEWKRQTWAQDKKKAYVNVWSFEVDLSEDNLYIIKGSFGIKDTEDLQFELIAPAYADESFIAGMFSQYLFDLDSKKDVSE